LLYARRCRSKPPWGRATPRRLSDPSSKAYAPFGAIYRNYIPDPSATTNSAPRRLADTQGHRRGPSVGRAQVRGNRTQRRAILGRGRIAITGDIGKDRISCRSRISVESDEEPASENGDAAIRAGLGGGLAKKDSRTSTEDQPWCGAREVVEQDGPPFVPVIIPANTYAGQDKELPTAGGHQNYW